ncbi:hypothetical protein AU467_33685 [Mesorhizobium loti]|uniref:Uncharacterized protein n=1 Tax=Rhizobium loti TaxID=381 RepID=A0A124GFE8_RHILI|nr:hypothetical protein AU467_33685 [Mesorhizobium loti]
MHAGCAIVGAVGGWCDARFCFGRGGRISDLRAGTAPDNPPDPRAFVEKDWSLESWQTLIGAAFGSASFSMDRLAHFPDGYPVRVADMDFHLGDGNAGFYGHAKIAISIRESRYGFVTCGLMGNSADEAARMWAPLADAAEKVVNSFVLDAD